MAGDGRLSPEQREELAAYTAHEPLRAGESASATASSAYVNGIDPGWPRYHGSIDDGGPRYPDGIDPGGEASAPPDAPPDGDQPEAIEEDARGAEPDQPGAPDAPSSSEPKSLWDRILQALGIAPDPEATKDARGLAGNLQRFAGKDTEANRAEAARIWGNLTAGRISLDELRDGDGNIRIGAYTLSPEVAGILGRIIALDPKDEAAWKAIGRAIGSGAADENGLTAGQRAVLRGLLADKVETGALQAGNEGFSAFDIARLDDDGAAIEQRAIDRFGAGLLRQAGRGGSTPSPGPQAAIKPGGKPYVSTVERRQLDRTLAERAAAEEKRAAPRSFKAGTADRTNDDLAADYKSRHHDKKFHPPYLPGTAVHEYQVGPTDRKDDRFIRLHTTDYPYGRWLVRQADVIDPTTGRMLSPDKLKDKLPLPEMPTHYREVNMPPGTSVRMGVVNPHVSWGKGRAIQYEIVGKWQEEWFGAIRGIAK